VLAGRGGLASFENERKLLGGFEGFDRQIDVQTRPIEMRSVEQLKMINIRHLGCFKPREFREGKKMLSPIHPQPHPVGCDVLDFSSGNVFSRRG
jgi:hypothetical protein